ncbi:MAG: tetratricopeptide repeat protein [Acidobacteria bacterium]|nr:tetratricopeptide repeat protein [Acidobacteriota bacterium]
MPKKALLALGSLLVLATLAAYVPALKAGFVWNDDTYVTENPTLDGLAGLHLIWTDTKANEQYYPMVFTSYWIEKRLWGLAPLGYHLVNVLLHAANALLLWILLARLGLPGPGWAAALFALHPMCVESVAWVAERKNTLSLFLSLLAMLAYLSSREAKERKTGGFFLFVLALFAKTTAVVVPAVLLVLVWWKRGEIRGKDAGPLVPWFAAGIALAAHTAWLERTVVAASGKEWSLGLAGRLVLAGEVVLFYSKKFFIPLDLSFFYERWTVDARAMVQWLPSLGALALLVLAWRFRERLGRGPLAFLLLFGGVLFPAMGFFNVYAMRYSWVADHFAYQAVAVASAGLACGAALALAKAPPLWRRAAAAAGAGILVFLGVLTFRQARIYEGEETLWKDTLSKNSSCFSCETNYGFFLVNAGRTSEGVAHFEASLKLKPDNVPALLNLGRAAEQRGSLGEAAARLREAYAIDPSDGAVLVNLATVEVKLGRAAEAIPLYEAALRLGTADAHLAHNGLGVAFMRQGRVAEAAGQFREALRLRPDYDFARANLERALAALGAAP